MGAPVCLTARLGRRSLGPRLGRKHQLGVGPTPAPGLREKHTRPAALSSGLPRLQARTMSPGSWGRGLKGGAGWHVASSGLRYRRGGSRRPPRHVTGPSHSVARFSGPRLSRESGGFLRTFNRESRNTKCWHLRFSAGTRARVSARPSEPGTGPIPGAAPRIRPCPSLWCLLRRLTYTWVRGILTHPVPVLVGGAWRS